jgi:hypothetical protein
MDARLHEADGCIFWSSREAEMEMPGIGPEKRVVIGMCELTCEAPGHIPRSELELQALSDLRCGVLVRG